MKQSLKDIRLLLLRLSVALLAYPIGKTLFFIFNHSYFTDVSLGEFFKILFFGLRFDISAVIFMNSPFILLHIIPFGFTKRKWYQIILTTVFITINSIAILSDCVDLEYFNYTHKRITADFFALFSLGNDIPNLLPAYIRDFWYVVLIWIALTFLIAWLYKKKESEKVRRGESVLGSPSHFPTFPPSYISRFALWTLLNSILICLFIIGFRGGIQLRPIMTITAAEYVFPKNIPLVINTPFSIMRSFELEKLEEKNYFPEEEAKGIFNPIHQPAVRSQKPEARINIFIIILEGFSKEYTGLGRRKTYTPFLDSLIGESLVFDRAYANGKKSMEGIPAILASIPALMTEPYITSSYNSNQFTSLANILKKNGSVSAFFHGGTNGTMGFDAFCSAAGFDHYFGRKEYNNENDYDGEWGIWDEDFFQFTKEKVNGFKEPFLAVLFSLSSHHPYPVPEKYKTILPQGKHPILQSIAYTDLALRKFFYSASKEKWFGNTLFVLTADHTGPSTDIFYGNSAGSFQIPIIFYTPNGEWKGINHRITQQIDILPTIFNYLNYDEDFFSFGKDAMDSLGTGYAVNFINDIYQIIQDDYLLQFDGNKTLALYNYRTDSLLQKNMSGTTNEIQIEMEKKLKAIIQTFNNGMITNKMKTVH